jgi:predicted dehydrogenase
MKVLIVGAGSMGQRRLRDLVALEVEDIMLFEPRVERCKQVAATFDIAGFSDLEEALAQHPDTMFVATPPALHDIYVRKAIECRMHVFVEVPFSLSLELLEAIATLRKSSIVFGISHTIRYYPPFRIIYDAIHSGGIGKPLYVEYSLGNYLPDWHPHEDYRTFYASDVNLGGAGMDMLLHELHAIQWWLGKVDTVYASFSKLSTLDIRGSDNHNILLSFEGGARGFFHHDIIERGTVGRHVRIVGGDGTIEWHQNLPTIRVFDSASGYARHLPFSEATDWNHALEASRTIGGPSVQNRTPPGDTPKGAFEAQYSYESNYLREVRYFLDAVRGRHDYTMSNVAEELQNVRTFYAIRMSAEQSREVRVADLVHKVAR